MSTPDFRFEPAQMPANTAELRRDVRDFLDQMKKKGLFKPGPHGWSEGSREFSLALGRRGWIGMTWPKRYGGHERSALERYVVTEELLGASAPATRPAGVRPCHVPQAIVKLSCSFSSGLCVTRWCESCPPAPGSSSTRWCGFTTCSSDRPNRVGSPNRRA